ncbi:NADPH-dependent conjugated polyketone reductase C1 [Mycena sanguinolenta]|uniref:NADPH-dependent conjugated polyketone reductase C1 n=1 Tax=Mycena sanguinolenta TaxID=230812 RepID=A0A8H6YFX3_9AGAR|nr:NADPH-dependent conjugated polyketone reductase C1 [Mycena sanguinolenta]
MPWDFIRLNDGRQIPSIGFGTWKLGNGQGTIDQVNQAISVGFSHVATAQASRNESEAGIALRESGLERTDIFITTEYSGLGGLDIRTSINNSLKNLGVSYVDLYLIQHPRLAVPDIPIVWAEMEAIQAEGLAKSIGVSNFSVEHLDILFASAKVKPATNQILLHPYVYARQLPILEYAAKHNIVIEATARLRGPVDAPVRAIANRLGVSTDQVLAWTKAKGAVVITYALSLFAPHSLVPHNTTADNGRNSTSSKSERLVGYLSAGDLQLTADDILAIDVAGAT